MQIARTVRAAMVAALSATSMFAVQGQTLVGDEIDAGLYFTVDTGYGIGRIPGVGLDGPFTVETGWGDAKIAGGIFELNVESLHFEVDFLAQASWEDGVVLRLTDFDFLNIPLPVYMAGLGYIESNLIGDYSVTHTADSIEVAWGGTSFNQDTYLKVFFGPSPLPPIPEPETWALMLVGLAGVGAAARRRRRR
jgi:hypothetical protein